MSIALLSGNWLGLYDRARTRSRAIHAQLIPPGEYGTPWESSLDRGAWPSACPNIPWHMCLYRTSTGSDIITTCTEIVGFPNLRPSYQRLSILRVRATHTLVSNKSLASALLDLTVYSCRYWLPAPLASYSKMPTSKSEEGSMDATVQDGPPTPEPEFKPGSAFWMSFIAIIVSLFLSAVDLTGVSVTLPTITQDLNGGEDFVWVGSAYSLASTAILPLTGSLANIFGRKPIMVISITIFALGSALSGAAQNMNMMIGARSMFSSCQSPVNL